MMMSQQRRACPPPCGEGGEQSERVGVANGIADSGNKRFIVSTPTPAPPRKGEGNNGARRAQ